MNKSSKTKKIIIASNNSGKVREFKQLLEPLGYDVLSQSEAGVCISVDETGDTFEENARLKAAAIVEWCDNAGITAAVISDDSGLCVDAISGRPGVYSADYDVPWLITELKNVAERKSRTARFVCCICYHDSNGEVMVRGECEGWIGFEERGTGGFGYDPVFMIGERSFAEYTAEEKNAVSHRGIALRKLVERLT
ncbi:MAG: RdgB/HAM1 family non-canonical purine NTP pyrophosphatase [Oscillospiraceae bacterium]|nr:RdgB/HAM1 family non-canonical purine NTP pyrophosphatase [Oscillospiraceae bacterium]